MIFKKIIPEIPKSSGFASRSVSKLHHRIWLSALVSQLLLGYKLDVAFCVQIEIVNAFYNSVQFCGDPINRQSADGHIDSISIARHMERPHVERTEKLWILEKRR